MNDTFLKLKQKFKNAVNILSKRIQNLFKHNKTLEISSLNKNDDWHNEDFLNQGTVWVKSVSWALIGTTGLGIAWLVFARTEEIVIAKGKLEPIGEVKEIYLPS